MKGVYKGIRGETGWPEGRDKALLELLERRVRGGHGSENEVLRAATRSNALPLFGVENDV